MEKIKKKLGLEMQFKILNARINYGGKGDQER